MARDAVSDHPALFEADEKAVADDDTAMSSPETVRTASTRFFVSNERLLSVSCKVSVDV